MGFSLVVARGGIHCWGCWLLIAVASFAVEHIPRALDFSSSDSQALEHRLNSCGAWAYLLRGMWDCPRSGIEPVSPALAGRF